MTSPGILFRKELRALAPAFVATLLSLLLAALTPDLIRSRLVVLVFTFGTMGLGSLPFGHEYTHRTLSLMLTQPCTRRQLFTAKMGILVPMVLIVTAVTLTTAPPQLFLRFLSPASESGMLLVFAPLCAIGLVPALSLLSRSALPAAVFAVAILGILAAAANGLGLLIYGVRQPVLVVSFTTAALWRTVPLLCAASAIAGWVLFSRLQAIEGHADLHAPGWLRGNASARSAARVRSPYFALLAKELRLQQLTFVVVGFYLVMVAAVWILQRGTPDYLRVPVEAITVMYVALLVLLIGSMASAEERHLGTLPPQLLLPISARRQWAVKVAVTLGLALTLGVALPLIVGYAFEPTDNQLMRLQQRIWEALAGVVVLTSGSLYISTLCSSGVRALITSIPAALTVAVMSSAWVGMIWSVGHRIWYENSRLPGSASVNQYELFYRAQLKAADIVIATALIAALLFVAFGHVNHRSIDGSARRTALQLLIMAATAAVLLMLPIGVFYYYSTP